MKKIPDLIITLPAYNEAGQLKEKVLQLSKYSQNHLKKYFYKIIIAENGSKDSTAEIGYQLADKLEDVYFYKHPKQGRGKTIYHLWKKMKARCYAYMDVDLATDINHLPELVESILEKHNDLCIGTRNAKDSRVHRGLKRTIISKGYISLLKLIFNLNVSDTQCGFKAISQRAIKVVWPMMDPANWTGAAWFFDAELLIISEKLGLKIDEIPVKWTEAPGTTVSIRKTIQEDLSGIIRLLKTQPWMNQRN